MAAFVKIKNAYRALSEIHCVDVLDDGSVQVCFHGGADCVVLTGDEAAALTAALDTVTLQAPAKGKTPDKK